MKIARRYFIKIISMITIIILFTFSFCVDTIAETGYKLNNIHNMKLQCDSNSVYITGYYGSTITAGFLYNGYDQREFQALGNVKYIAVNNGSVYALSDYNGSIVLSKYIYSEDTLLSYNFGSIKINSEYKFCVSNDRIYLAENNISNTFSCYNIYGEKQYSFKTVDMLDYFTANNNMYLVSHSNIYAMETNFNVEPSLILTTDSLRPNAYMSDGVIADYGGYIVDAFRNTSVFTGITDNNINCAYSNGYYCRYSSGNIYGYSSNGNKNVLYRTGFSEKAQMCGFNDSIYLLSEYGSLSIINKNELSYPQNNVTNPPQNSSSSINHDSNRNDNNNSNSQINNDSQNGNSQVEKHFSINNYYIDEEKKIIWNIPQGTTIASLKNNITYDGYSLEFYNSENVKKTSGKVGTGFYFTVLDGGKECDRYTLSVLGDLTGEGSVNRNDVKLLCKYLDKCTSITDEQYVASDVNDDGIINGVDILKIAKNNL